jgi:type IV pilus assembly protein PilA
MKLLDGRGFTLIELLIAVAIIGILLSVSMGGYRYARIRGGETSAIASLQAINQAQFAYLQTCGNQRYAASLPGLATPPPGSTAPYLSPDLTQAEQVVKSGYLIRMAGTEVSDAAPTCNGVPPVSAYHVTADPVNPGFTGVRYFGTNKDGAIYQDTQTFDGSMPEAGSPTHGTELR